MCTTELQRPIYFMCAYILRYCLGTCEELSTVSLQHFQGGLIIEDIAQTLRASANLINQLIPLKGKFYRMPYRICSYYNSSAITQYRTVYYFSFSFYY